MDTDLSTQSTLKNLTDLFFEEVEDGLSDLDKAAAAAELACAVSNQLNASSSITRGDGLYCPHTFDGWSCWNETPAGDVAYAPCPWFVSGFDPNLMAHKSCQEDGQWFRHPESNVTWSNYTTCIDYAAFNKYKTLVTIYECGYLLSLFALVTSLIIFCSFRSLQCTRVRIHKHLFFSFIIHNSFWLIWYRFVVNEETPVNELNQVGCAILHLLVQYFLVANYFWMFCEGFFLHTIIVWAFSRKEGLLLRCFYVFAWVGPSFLIALYAICRALDPEHTQQKDCWIHESKWTLILSIPVCICLILSLLFLLNILRVLLIKINTTRQLSTPSAARRESTMTETSESLRKAARTLILIPLLGVHYFIIPLRPDPESEWAFWYDLISAIFSSLQGLAVSLLFCFCNGEVVAAIRRKISRNRKVNRDFSSYGRTTSSAKVLKRQTPASPTSTAVVEAHV